MGLQVAQKQQIHWQGGHIKETREETDSRVARCIYACGIPFNVDRSPYWQDMIRAINKAPQGYKGPNYEKVRTQLLKNEKELVEDILAPIRSSWSSSGVTIVSDGWTDTRRRPLINIIATSPKGAMFIKAEDCSGEVKDAQFIADFIIKAIEQIGLNRVVQVITDNAPVCKVAEEVDNKVSWIKELTGEAREIVKFITNHHQSQAILREYSKLELLKVAETRYASNFLMLRRLVEVKHALVSMVVSQLWIEWRQADSERGSMVRRLCLDEDWWSKVNFLLKFTTLAFELLRSADTDQPFLGEVYDSMDSMVEKTMEIISQESPQILFVDDHFAGLVKKIIVDRWNNLNTPLHTLAHALNPKFYDEELIAQSNEKRKAPHKDREVANGVKKALTRMFPSHLHREVKEEFASFAAGIDDYADILALEERSTMNPVRWWICHGANGVHLQNLAICIISQVASFSSAERNWSTYGFIHSVKRNKLGSQKAEDLVYVLSNLRLASRRGPEYNSGPIKEWDVDAENPDFDLSFAALNIEAESGSEIGASSSSTPPSTVEHCTASIFDEDCYAED
eukprot:PITA_04206